MFLQPSACHAIATEGGGNLRALLRCLYLDLELLMSGRQDRAW